jgi:histidine triad (HIT) family protein
VSDCIFCKIASGEIKSNIVHEDERMVAFKDLQPVAPVHVLLIPRRHIAHLQEVSANDAADLGHLIASAPVVAEKMGLATDGFRLVNNCKEKAGQSVFHVHFHLLGGRTFSWPPG